MSGTDERQYEAVFIRHVIEGRRTDIEALDSLIKPSMESRGSVTVYGGDCLPRNGYDWVAACRFSDRKWLPLFSNVASSEELFDANAKNRRTEVARAEHSSDGTHVIHINRSKKAILRFEWGDSNAQPTVFESTELSDDYLHDLTKASAAYRRLCQHYELPAKPRSVQPGKHAFTVFGTSGTPIKASIRDMAMWSQRQMKGGTKKAGKLLERGIDTGDVERVRQAIAEGASLDWLPEHPSITALTSAVYKAGRTKAWREVAEAILDAGADINGSGPSGPPIVSACQNFIGENLSLEMVQFLLDHGADVNAQDEQGNTAIGRAIGDDRRALVDVLMAAGADPTIPDQFGSPLDRLRKRVEKSLKRSGYSDKADLLSRLTGEEIVQPAEESFTPELAAENERLGECAQARAMLAALKEPLDYQESDAADLRELEDFPAVEKKLLALGFEPAGGARIRNWSHAAFTHQKKRVDAVVYGCWTDGLFSPLRMAIDMGAYFKDGSHVSVSNGLEPPGAVSTFMSARTGPDKLLKQLEKEIGTRKPIAIKPAGFAKRHEAAVHQVIVASCDRHTQTLELKARADGFVPRFEKLGCFPDLRRQKDPTWSSASISRDALKDLREDSAERSSDYRLRSAIGDGADLLALRHLEFAGRPRSLEFVSDLGDAGVRLFALMAKTRDAFKEDYVADKFEFTLFALALSERWDDVASVCASLKPAFVSGGYRSATDLPRSQAKFWVLVANSFRKKDVQGSSKFAEAIRKDRQPLPKRLLTLWEAIEGGDAKETAKALAKSLTVKTEPVDRLRDTWTFLAWPQSVLMLIARHRGLEITTDDNERLVTAESLGFIS